MRVYTAKFRREFGWACRTGCSPRPDGQQMSLPAKSSQWRVRDNMADAAPRRHQHHLFSRFSDVMRRENTAAAAAAATTAAEGEKDAADPPADVIVA